jgi:hypothetical protein
MADNYSLFAAFIPVPTHEESRSFVRRLGKMENSVELQPGYEGDFIGGDSRVRGYHICSEDSFDPDELAQTLRAHWRKWKRQDVIAITWADTCSKPRAGEFGGGAIVVGPRGYRVEGAYTTAERLAKKVEAKAPAKTPDGG